MLRQEAPMYQKILVVVTAHAASQAAVRHAVQLAGVHGSELLFLYVMPRYVLPIADMPPAVLEPPEEFLRAARETADSHLAEAMREAQAAGVMSNRSMTSGTDDALSIAEAAVRQHCDLIVAATEGRNAVMRILSGSVLPGLITAATVPVLVCRPDASARLPGLRPG
jgi:nucleotide-binding universal stress UspA family protein